jgi:hypothetical protein
MALSLQRQWNAYAAFKVQSGLGTLATGAGANFITLSGGTGNVTQTPINSILVRQDGMSLRGRGGTFATAGQYPGELNLGNYDSIFEAVMRGTWTGGGSLGGHILTNPPAGSLVRRYFTIEEVELDLGISQVYQDCVWTKFDRGCDQHDRLGVQLHQPELCEQQFYTAGCDRHVDKPRQRAAARDPCLAGRHYFVPDDRRSRRCGAARRGIKGEPRRIRRRHESLGARVHDHGIEPRGLQRFHQRNAAGP